MGSGASNTYKVNSPRYAGREENGLEKMRSPPPSGHVLHLSDAGNTYGRMDSGGSSMLPCSSDLGIVDNLEGNPIYMKKPPLSRGPTLKIQTESKDKVVVQAQQSSPTASRPSPSIVKQEPRTSIPLHVAHAILERMDAAPSKDLRREASEASEAIVKALREEQQLRKQSGPKRVWGSGSAAVRRLTLSLASMTVG